MRRALAFEVTISSFNRVFRVPLPIVLLVLASLFSAAPTAFASTGGRICDPMTYGAKADGTTKDTGALQHAIDECSAQGGGTVRLSAGTFLTAPLTLKSHVTLDIAPGATLLGSQDRRDYPPVEEFREQALQPLISATNSEDITITGGGAIDGAGEVWWKEMWEARREHRHTDLLRPRLVVFDHCRHIRIHNVTIRNSPMWQVVLYYSDDVAIDNARILAPRNAPNTDGIDPFSSHHVTISHVTIDTGDDDIAIKSGQPGSPGGDEPSTDISITDSTFLHGHGMSIGSEVAGGVHNVRVARIHFKDTDNGIRVKSNRDRGNDISDLHFRDITMKDVKTPILISEYYPKIPANDEKQPVTRLTPHFHDISIKNLTAVGAKTAGFIVGLPESPVTSLTLTNVHISARKGMTISNATVTAHDFTVQAMQGDPLTMMANAKIHQK